MADIKNGTVTIEGLDELDKKLAQLKTDSPGFEKRLRDVIRKVLGRARANLRKEAASGLQMQSDPRKAYKAVRFAVYKKIFGGQVNILQSRKAGKGHLYEPPRKLRPGQRGGNRVPRGKRTTDLMIYEGMTRGFVLRFLNQGTGSRMAGSRGGHLTGNRGSITARNWFGNASMREMQAVAGTMQELIDKIIKEEFI
jgi:hypothetical protein